jgi:hypothetical protein
MFPHVDFLLPKRKIKMTTPKKTHGGKRAGAGLPPAPPILTDTLPSTSDPLEFLKAAMNDAGLDMRVRVECARAMLPYMHQKTSEPGKKETAQQAAGKAAAGKYAPSRPPPLRSV